jgi:hypothetical protein
MLVTVALLLSSVAGILPLPRMAVPMKSENRSLPNQRVAPFREPIEMDDWNAVYKSMKASMYEIIDKRRSYSPRILLTLTRSATLPLG